MTAGVGANQPTWQAVQDALEAHGKAVWGDEYVMQDFVAIGYVVSMENDSDRAEYFMVSSTGVPHIVNGLIGQINMFDDADEPGD